MGELPIQSSEETKLLTTQVKRTWKTAAESKWLIVLFHITIAYLLACILKQRQSQTNLGID